MRIAFISYGFGEYSVRHANALAREHDVLLAIPDVVAHDYRQLIESSVELRPFQHSRLRQPLRQLRSTRAIVRSIDCFRPDVVHFQHGHLWFNLVLPRLKRYPLVITIHDPRHHRGDLESQKTPQAMLDFGYRQADQVIVHARSLVGAVESAIGIEADRIHVVPHIAIGDPLASSPVQSEDSNQVLFFGRIWAYKGLAHLIRAEPRISEQVPNVEFVIAGEGDDLAPYRQMMVNPQRFTIHNRWIDDAQQSELFQQAAVVVLPYTEATQSGVVPVAYTFAKPVVATRVGGLPECVEHERTGLLIPPGDEVALADAIVRLLRDPGQRRAMGENGRRKLLAESSGDVVAEKCLEVYRLAMQDHNARTPCIIGA
jgi:glycosyltransferase involved in cell wall biosynthesis